MFSATRTKWLDKNCFDPEVLQVLKVRSELLRLTLSLLQALLNDITSFFAVLKLSAMSPQPFRCCDKDRWQQVKASDCTHYTWYNECKRINQMDKPLELMTDDEVSSDISSTKKHHR